MLEEHNNTRTNISSEIMLMCRQTTVLAINKISLNGGKSDRQQSTHWECKHKIKSGKNGDHIKETV